MDFADRIAAKYGSSGGAETTSGGPAPSPTPPSEDFAARIARKYAPPPPNSGNEPTTAPSMDQPPVTAQFNDLPPDLDAALRGGYKAVATPQYASAFNASGPPADLRQMRSFDVNNPNPAPPGLPPDIERTQDSIPPQRGMKPEEIPGLTPEESAWITNPPGITPGPKAETVAYPGDSTVEGLAGAGNAVAQNLPFPVGNAMRRALPPTAVESAPNPSHRVPALAEIGGALIRDLPAVIASGPFAPATVMAQQADNQAFQEMRRADAQGYERNYPADLLAGTGLAPSARGEGEAADTWGQRAARFASAPIAGAAAFAGGKAAQSFAQTRNSAIAGAILTNDTAGLAPGTFITREIGKEILKNFGVDAPAAVVQTFVNNLGQGQSKIEAKDVGLASLMGAITAIMGVQMPRAAYEEALMTAEARYAAASDQMRADVDSARAANTRPEPTEAEVIRPTRGFIEPVEPTAPRDSSPVEPVSPAPPTQEAPTGEIEAVPSAPAAAALGETGRRLGETGRKRAGKVATEPPVTETKAAAPETEPPPPMSASDGVSRDHIGEITDMIAGQPTIAATPPSQNRANGPSDINKATSAEIVPQPDEAQTLAAQGDRPTAELQATEIKATDVPGSVAPDVDAEERLPGDVHNLSNTQLDVPSAEAAPVMDFGKTIPETDLAGDGRETQPHITIKYGLYTRDAAKVRAVLAGEGPIKVKLGEVSTFPPSKGSDGAEVLKVDIEGEALHRLNQKIADALPHSDSHPVYKPHMTIAYVNPGTAAKYTGAKDFTGKEITLRALTFSSRTGEMIEIPLTGEAGAHGTLAENDANATAAGKTLGNLGTKEAAIPNESGVTTGKKVGNPAVPEAAPPAPQGDTGDSSDTIPPPTDPRGGFRTANGVQYAVHTSGGTTRADRRGQMMPPSSATFYVAPEHLPAISKVREDGEPRRELAVVPGTKTVGVRIAVGKRAGKFDKRTIVPFEDQPKVGLHPVEMRDVAAGPSIGHAITEIIPPTAAPSSQKREKTGKTQPSPVTLPKAGDSHADRPLKFPAVALPAELAGAKPNYSYGDKRFSLEFGSDLDKAAYITAQTKPSKRDAAYIAFVQKHTGADAATVRAHGAAVRARIKRMAKTSPSGVLEIPASTSIQQSSATPSPESGDLEGLTPIGMESGLRADVLKLAAKLGADGRAAIRRQEKRRGTLMGVPINEIPGLAGYVKVGMEKILLGAVRLTDWLAEMKADPDIAAVPQFDDENLPQLFEQATTAAKKEVARLANPGKSDAGRKMVAEIDAGRAGRRASHTGLTLDALRREADRLLDEDMQGQIRRLTEVIESRATLGPEDTAIANEAARRLMDTAAVSSSVQEVTDAVRFMNLYRESGKWQAVAFNLRQDLVMGPRQRIADWLSRELVMPRATEAAKIVELEKVADDLAARGKTAHAAFARAQVTAASERAAAQTIRDREALKAVGVSVEEIINPAPDPELTAAIEAHAAEVSKIQQEIKGAGPANGKTKKALEKANARHEKRLEALQAKVMKYAGNKALIEKVKADFREEAKEYRREIDRISDARLEAIKARGAEKIAKLEQELLHLVNDPDRQAALSAILDSYKAEEADLRAQIQEASAQERDTKELTKASQRRMDTLNEKMKAVILGSDARLAHLNDLLDQEKLAREELAAARKQSGGAERGAEAAERRLAAIDRKIAAIEMGLGPKLRKRDEVASARAEMEERLKNARRMNSRLRTAIKRNFKAIDRATGRTADAELNRPGLIAGLEAVRQLRAIRTTVPDRAYEVFISSILSSPKTIMATTLADATHQAYIMALRKPVEAALELITGNPGAAGELGYFYAGVAAGIGPAMRNFVRTWKHEISALDLDHAVARGEELVDKEGDVVGVNPRFSHMPAISGKKGKILRFFLRNMVAENDLFATLAAHGEASALAYGVARDEGKTGPAFAHRVAELIADKSSDVWREGIDLARESTMQAPLGKFANKGLELRNAFNKYGIPFGKFLMPFISFAVNSFKTGARISPFGVAPLAVNILRQGFESVRPHKSGWTYSWKKARQHSAEQVLAFAAMYALWSMLTDEDDQGLPFITGTVPFRATSKGERDLAARTAPAQTIRLGKSRYSYARLDPVSTALAATIDAINDWRALRGGASSGKALALAWQHVLGNIRDKTFLKTLGDLADAFDSVDRLADIPAGILTGIVVPWSGLVRAVSAATDKSIHERPQGVVQKVVYRAFPTAPGAPPPKVGWFGEDIQKASTGLMVTDFLWNVVSPIERTKEPNVVGDARSRYYVAIQRWNMFHPDDAFLPSPPQRFITADKERIELTDAQYHTLMKSAGDEFYNLVADYEKSLPGMRIDPRKPTKENIRAFRRFMEYARDLARDRMVASARAARQVASARGATVR